MVYFDIALYHRGYFGYVDGIRRLGDEDVAALWYKDPAIENMSIGLRMFLNDKNALNMVKIAEQRGHVELFVVHEDNPEEGIASTEVDGSGDDDSDYAEYVPSCEDADSVDDIQFTDNEEEFDLDDNFFGVQTDAGKKDADQKGKGVVNEEFHDDGEDSDELKGEYEVRGGNGKEGDTVVFPVHRKLENMACYNWKPGVVYATKDDFKDAMIGHSVYTKRRIKFQKVDRKRLRSAKMGHNCAQMQRVGILKAKWLGKEFKKKVQNNPKVKIKELVAKADRILCEACWWASCIPTKVETNGKAPFKNLGKHQVAPPLTPCWIVD
ncbi:hypothetical protein PIB30_040723 [Stylosanthes scabra]|uniref:PB1-like domain-containing protein n=1 Tax=Stylosanthes scabra TaxID=79078 RepID=A0ABU6UDB4_9FABA|nr:hypothetical protein [Stylosanthes scabra]